jgi:hypothetical protein
MSINDLFEDTILLHHQNIIGSLEHSIFEIEQNIKLMRRSNELEAARYLEKSLDQKKHQLKSFECVVKYLAGVTQTRRVYA